MKRSIAAPAIVLLLVAGCGRERADRAPSAPSAAQGTPQIGGTLLRRLELDIATLNPVLATSRYDRLVDSYLFTPLVHLDSELRPIAGLAESWDVSPDGRVYTFRLNRKATFSDGRPVRASDVIFTLRKIIDPQSEAVQIASYFDHLDPARTRAVDDHTVIIAFREPLASQLTQFNNVLVLPEHVYSKGDFRNDYNSAAVGSGPYRLVRRIPGREVVLQRRADYWDANAHIENIIFKVVTNDATAWNAARVGGVDETMVQSEIWNRERTNTTLNQELDFRSYYGLAYNYIAWNGRAPLFREKRIRHALSMCLDTGSIIRNLYGGTARALNGHFLPEQWAFNPQVKMVTYDAEGARQIFASLGWRDSNGDGIIDKGGKPFRFQLMIMSGSAQARSIAQLFQNSLRQVGVQAEISVVDGAAAIQRILAGNYEAVYLSWDLDPDPDPFPLFHSSQFPPRGQNFVYYSNPRADLLIERGRRELDFDRRRELYRELHAVLAEDQPYTWVNQPAIKWVFNRRVNDVNEARGYGYFLWYPGELAWWLAAPR